MDERTRNHETRDVIADSAAAQLLKRAVEIDAKRGMSVSITDLRAAAMEAGISTDAFEDALAELRARDPRSVASPGRTRRLRQIGIAALTAMMLVAGYLVTRLLSPARAPVATMEQIFSLQCIGGQEAAIQVRDAVGPEGTISITKGAPHILRVRTTPKQMQDVQSILGRIDGPESSACASRVNRPDTVLHRGIATGD